MIPYTYLIGWSFYNKFYYGVRYSKHCHPSDLWRTYFTSSKYVKQFREENGEPDIIQIRKIFNNSISARIYENKILKRLNVIHSSKWLNKTDNISFGPISVKWTEERKRKFSNFKLGKPSPNKGNKFSEESKNKMSNSRRNKYWFNNGVDEKKLALNHDLGSNWIKGRICKMPSRLGIKLSPEQLENFLNKRKLTLLRKL